LRPPSREPWFVLVNAPAGAPESEIDAYAGLVEAKLQLPPGAVVARGRRTPADLAAESGTPDGAIYGDAPHGRLGTLRRPGPLVGGLRGLVRCGGTVHPGGGVPLVMLSGLTAARLVEAGR
jgi:phytoene dehydrogenase-like protein